MKNISSRSFKKYTNCNNLVFVCFLGLCVLFSQSRGHQLGLKVLIASVVSLGLQRLHYNSCLIKHVLLLIFVFKYIKEDLQQQYKFIPHLNFVKVHDQVSRLLLPKTYSYEAMHMSPVLPDPPLGTSDRQLTTFIIKNASVCKHLECQTL